MTSTSQPTVAAAEGQVAGELASRQTREFADGFDDLDTEAELFGCSAWFDRVVAFRLADQCYALPINRVQEIQQIVAFSEVPTDGRGVVGMVNLRGTIIPAVDLRVLVGLPERDHAVDTPMIIGQSSSGLVALVVDRVDDVIDLPVACLQDPPVLHSLASKMIGVASVGDELAYVLDLDIVLAVSMADASESGATR